MRAGAAEVTVTNRPRPSDRLPEHGTRQEHGGARLDPHRSGMRGPDITAELVGPGVRRMV